jgi:hypothetical protein
MISAEKLIENLPFFNKTNYIFRGLIFDKDRKEADQISNINDLNRGTIYNMVEWHLRFKSRALNESILTNARTFFLEEWRKIFGVIRPSNIDDAEFVDYIIGKVVSSLGSAPAVYAIFQQSGEAGDLITAEEYGAFADSACSDVGPIDSTDPVIRMSTSVVTFDRSCMYVIITNPDSITSGFIQKLAAAMTGGVAIFIGVEENA